MFMIMGRQGIFLSTQVCKMPKHDESEAELDVVEHMDDPAYRDEELAREQEEHDWADRVMELIIFSRGEQSLAEEPNEECLVRIECGRCPQA